MNKEEEEMRNVGGRVSPELREERKQGQEKEGERKRWR